MSEIHFPKNWNYGERWEWMLGRLYNKGITGFNLDLEKSSVKILFIMGKECINRSRLINLLNFVNEGVLMHKENKQAWISGNNVTGKVSDGLAMLNEGREMEGRDIAGKLKMIISQWSWK